MRIKRVLLVNHPEADYTECFTYQGLCESLGEENVGLFPPKFSYWGETHKYPFPQNPSKEGCTGPYDFFLEKNKTLWNESSILNGNFDLIIMTVREGAKQAMRQLREHEITLPLVVIDGEDHLHLREDVLYEFGPKIYFKRELSTVCPKKIGDTFIYPLSLCSYVWSSTHSEDVAMLLNEPKKYKVVCVLGKTHPFREEVVAALKSMDLKDSFIGTSDELRFNCKNYLSLLAQARIGVSVRGHGFDTVRRWEIPSFKTLLISDRLPIETPYQYAEGHDADFYSTTDELKDKINFYLSKPIELHAVANSGFQHATHYHLCKHRAEQLLEKVEDVLYGETSCV